MLLRKVGGGFKLLETVWLGQKYVFFLPTNICQHFRRHWFAIVSKNGGFEIEFASKALLKLLYPEEQKHHGCEEKEFSLSDDNAPINEQFETEILVFVEIFFSIYFLHIFRPMDTEAENGNFPSNSYI